MSKYSEIMERLTVSEQTKEKLIAQAGRTERTEKGFFRPANVRRIGAIAACVVLLLVGAIVLKNVFPNGAVPSEGGTAGVIDAALAPAEYENAADLSAASGIEIDDLDNLPFKPEETSYLYYEEGIAEIVYSGGGDSLSYRVSNGNEDNSGDRDEYGKVYEEEIGSVVFTLKGEGDRIFCALFQRDGRSYSVTSTAGLTLDQLKKMF